MPSIQAPPNPLTKRPAESRAYAVDFVNLLASGETITSITSFTATPSGLTIGSPSVSGTQVVAQISGGVDQAMYHVTVTVVTSAGNTLQECGNLFISAC